MKFTTLTRSIVVASSIFGIVIVATSQPGQQGAAWPTHKIIPPSVGLDQMQEFKDAALLHINDLQMHGGSIGQDCVARGIQTKVLIDKTVMKDFFTEVIVVIKDNIAGSPGGGLPHAKHATPAEIAMLTYAFDQGLDMMKTRPVAGQINVSPTGISGHLSPKDMGMTDQQFKAMTMNYIDTHPMRFWNEARTGLASGR